MRLSRKEKDELGAKRFARALMDGKSQEEAFQEAHPNRQSKPWGSEIQKYSATPAVQRELKEIRAKFQEKLIRDLPEIHDRIKTLGGGQMVITRRDDRGHITGVRYRDHDSPDAALRANKTLLEAAMGKNQGGVNIEGDLIIHNQVTRDELKQAYREAFEEMKEKQRRADEIIDAEVIEHESE